MNSTLRRAQDKMSRNYHDILGIRRGATKEEIKRAYRRKARLYHPDVNHSPDAKRKFIEFKEAYEGLLDGRSYPANERIVAPKAKPAEKPKEGESRQRHHRDPDVTSEELKERARLARERKAREGREYYQRYKQSKKHQISKTIAYISVFLGFLLVLEYTLPYREQLTVLHDKYELRGKFAAEKTVSSRYHLVLESHDMPVDFEIFDFVEKGDTVNFQRTAIFGQLLKLERSNLQLRQSLPLHNLLLSGIWFYLLILFIPLLRPVVEGPHVSFYFFDFGMRTGIFVTVLFVLMHLFI